MAARALSRSALCTLAAAAMIAPLTPATAAEATAAEAVGFIVLKENGSGSASAAQGYLDKVLGNAAEINGWSAAVGKFHTKRNKAQRYIDQAKPSFGILSYGAYLGLRKAHGLTPIGRADVSSSGNAQYFVVSKTQVSVEGCKGKTLATNHSGDATFVDKVVSGADFDLADFEVVPTRRPVQTLKAVLNGEAECALVDDSQIVAMHRIDEGHTLRPVWSSVEMPGLVVVSFATADKELVKGLAGNLEKICAGSGKAACDAAGLKLLRPVAADAFAEHQKAYEG